MGVRIVKKKGFKSISYLLAVVLMLSTTFSSVAFASGEVNAEEAESPTLEITIEAELEKSQPQEMKIEEAGAEKSQPKKAPTRESESAETVEETGSGTPEDLHIGVNRFTCNQPKDVDFRMCCPG